MTDLAQVTRELAPTRTETEESATLLKDWQIASPDDYAWATDLAKDIKRKWSALEDKRKQLTKPLLDTKGAIDDLFKPTLYGLAGLEALIKGKIGGYVAAQEALRIATMQESAALFQAGGTPTAIIPAVPEAAGVSVKHVWDYEIVDPDSVPRQFCSPDAAKIRQAIRATDIHPELTPQMAGVRFFQATKVAVRK
jgi:hypothetical protein